MVDTANRAADRWAFHVTNLLSAANPPDRYCIDVGDLAIEVSRNFFPDDSIFRVVAED